MQLSPNPKKFPNFSFHLQNLRNIVNTLEPKISLRGDLF